MIVNYISILLYFDIKCKCKHRDKFLLIEYLVLPFHDSFNIWYLFVVSGTLIENSSKFYRKNGKHLLLLLVLKGDFVADDCYNA